jgi:hypothetical protein
MNICEPFKLAFQFLSNLPLLVFFGLVQCILSFPDRSVSLLVSRCDLLVSFGIIFSYLLIPQLFCICFS